MNAKREAAEAVCRRLSALGYRALFAGGCVRDMVLGVPPNDYDVATSAPPAMVESLFERTASVGAAFGVVLVLTDAGPIEVATFRADGPYLDGRHPSSVRFTSEEEDARRRDFTVNALFYDPASGDILDYVGGQADLAAGLIRAVGDPAARFNEDKLRLLRCVRFAARLGFPIEPATRAALIALGPAIVETSAERIRDELTKMLTEGAAFAAVTLLDETGLLDILLPEVAAMKGVEQPETFHPEGDVFVHTLLVMKHLDALPERPATLAWGALLHDVGKPPTQTFEDRIRFNNHDRVGAGMAAAICRRLRMARRDSDRIEWLVAQHMRPAVVPEMRENKRKRFVREEGFEEMLTLCELDCAASHGDASFVTWLRDYAASLPPESLRPAPLLTGGDLLAMGYAAGPLFREILTAVEDGQLEGALTSADEAKAFVSARWPLG